MTSDYTSQEMFSKEEITVESRLPFHEKVQL